MLLNNILNEWVSELLLFSTNWNFSAITRWIKFCHFTARKLQYKHYPFNILTLKFIIIDPKSFLGLSWLCDGIVFGFTTIYAISAYHHQRCGFEFLLRQGALNTTSCDKVCRWLAAGQWFPPPIKMTATI